MRNKERYTYDELLVALVPHGGWSKESITKLAESLPRSSIKESFTNDEFRLRTPIESKDCKPKKSFGLELLKLENREGRPPLVCGMRMLVPKSAASFEKNMRLDLDSPIGKLKVIKFLTPGKAARMPVDDVYLLGNRK